MVNLVLKFPHIPIIKTRVDKYPFLNRYSIHPRLHNSLINNKTHQYLYTFITPSRYFFTISFPFYRYNTDLGGIIMMIIGLLVVLLSVYLIYAMVNPEKF